MSDVELVIKIPEAEYDLIVNDEACGLNVLTRAIARGTLLPEGHGRLGDLDALEEEIVNGIKAGNYEEGYETFAHINDMDDCVECVKCADTIIPADKAEGEN